MWIAILVAERGFIADAMRRSVNPYLSSKALLSFTPVNLDYERFFDSFVNDHLKHNVSLGMTDCLCIHAGGLRPRANQQRVIKKIEEALAEHLGSKGISYREQVRVWDDDRDQLRAKVVAVIEGFGPTRLERNSSKVAPKFAGSQDEKALLEEISQRWRECEECLRGNSPRAAIILMGSLLEGALWLRATRESPHGPMFAATSAPKNTQGITKPLGDWTLESFIDVAGELDWISKEGKKLSKIIRQYRNYVHPREAVKDRSELSIRNAKLLWGVASEIVRDILK